MINFIIPIILLIIVLFIGFNFYRDIKRWMNTGSFVEGLTPHSSPDRKYYNGCHYVLNKNLKSKALLIYFDEFQVTNIVDAMILGKLIDKIFSENIKIIVTSNIKISDLYKDGLQRDQFKPFIEIMKKKTLEHELVIEDDYRKSKENQNDRFFSPLNQESNFKMNKFFRIISKDKKKTIQNLDVKGREFLIKEFYEGVVRLTFDELCDKNLGAEDYLEIAKVSKFMVIDKIPKFDDINSNQQQRFITLIDIVYDIEPGTLYTCCSISTVISIKILLYACAFI